jgi:hypothetical protein
MLDVKSSNKGILIPHISLTGTNDIITVPIRPESLLIFNDAFSAGPNAVSPGYYYWSNPRWIRLATNGNSTINGWLLGGNAGTTPSTHFVGTTDNNSMLFRVNYQKAGYIGVETNDGNVFWGYQSGNVNSGMSNVGIGVRALLNNTNVSNLLAIGDSTLFSNTTGTRNIAVGSKSLFLNDMGRSNTAVGYNALYSNTNGPENTAVGDRALYSNVSGVSNTAIGLYALSSNVNGDENTASGSSTLVSNVSGSHNTANGYEALNSNQTGSSNTAPWV